MLIQRLGAKQQLDENYIEKFLSSVKSNCGSVDRVWFSSEYGFPPIERHEEIADKLCTTAEKFRKAGIEVDLQISNTLGHGVYISFNDCSGLIYDGSPARSMVGHDGANAEYCFCYRDKAFTEYCNRVIKAYSKIKPGIIWIDDDLRLSNHAPAFLGCFCDDCIAEFNKRNLTDYTRERLVRQIENNDKELRGKYFDFMRRALYEFTFEICKAALSINPDVEFGYQYGGPIDAMFMQTGYVFDAMRDASGKAPYVRSGGGAYDDRNINDVLNKATHVQWLNSRLPEYVVQRYTEIENTPDIVYGKTIEGTVLESTLYLASGNIGNTYAMLSTAYEPPEWYFEFFKRFSECRPYWEKLSKTSAKTEDGGIRIVTPEDYGMTDLSADGGIRKGFTKFVYMCGTEFQRFGVPFTFEKREGRVNLLHYQNAADLSDKEIIELMKQPVVTDAQTLETLISKGYRFPIGVKSVSGSEELLLQESFLQHEINDGLYGKKWRLGLWCGAVYSLVCKDDKHIEPVTVYTEKVEEGLSPAGLKNQRVASAVITTEYGAKWFVSGYKFFSSGVSFDKRNQIIAACEYISGKPISCRFKNRLPAVLYERLDVDGKTSVVSILKASIGNSGECRLRIENPSGTRFMLMSTDSKKVVAKAIKDGNAYEIIIPNIQGYQVVSLFCEKEGKV